MDPTEAAPSSVAQADGGVSAPALCSTAHAIDVIAISPRAGEHGCGSRSGLGRCDAPAQAGSEESPLGSRRCRLAGGGAWLPAAQGRSQHADPGYGARRGHRGLEALTTRNAALARATV